MIQKRKTTTVKNFPDKGLYIKYVGSGARRFLWGHEKFQTYINGS